jgi:hypothetical protein
MQRPIMITALQMYNVLCDQFPDLHSNALNLKLQDMLQQPVPCNCLTRIAAAKFWVPIDGVTHNNHNLHIPDSNLDGITTIYLTDLSTWIMYIQSNVDKGLAYAWEIIYTRPGGQHGPFDLSLRDESWHIRPFNSRLRDESWRVDVTDRIYRYVREYINVCQAETKRHEFIRQVGTASMQVTQRTASFTADWFPSLDPALDELETEIMNQILNSCSDPQTN